MSLNITPVSQFCVTVDRYADYIPIVGTMTSLIHLFLQYVVAPNLTPTDLAQSHYFTYLGTKSLTRCLTSLVLPILGNIIIGFCDLYIEVLAREVENQKPTQDNIKDYLTLADRGHIESSFKIGCLLLEDPILGEIIIGLKQGIIEEPEADTTPSQVDENEAMQDFDYEEDVEEPEADTTISQADGWRILQARHYLRIAAAFGHLEANARLATTPELEIRSPEGELLEVV
jgi:hypothetical protein